MSKKPEEIALNTLIEELTRSLAPILAVPKVWLNEDEASRYLSLSVHSLRAWRSREGSDGPSYHRIKGRILYSRKDLDTWVRKHRVKEKGELING